MTRLLLSLAALALAAGPAPAQFGDEPGGKAKKFTDLAEVSLTVTPDKGKPGDAVTVRLTLRPKNGGYTYPFNPPPGQSYANTWLPPSRETTPLAPKPVTSAPLAS